MFSTDLLHLLPHSTLTGSQCFRLIALQTWDNLAPSINACVTLFSVRVVRPAVLVTISWRSAHSTTCSHAKSPDFKHVRQRKVLCFPSKPFKMSTLALNPAPPDFLEYTIVSCPTTSTHQNEHLCLRQTQHLRRLSTHLEHRCNTCCMRFRDVFALGSLTTHLIVLCVCCPQRRDSLAPEVGAPSSSSNMPPRLPPSSAPNSR